jgi:hypothetical protein
MELNGDFSWSKSYLFSVARSNKLNMGHLYRTLHTLTLNSQCDWVNYYAHLRWPHKAPGALFMISILTEYLFALYSGARN